MPIPLPLPLPPLGFSTYQYFCYSNKATKIASICLAPPCLSPYPPPLGFSTYQYSCYSNKATKIASICLAPPCLSPYPSPSHLWVSVLTSTFAIATRQLRLHPSAWLPHAYPPTPPTFGFQYLPVLLL